VQIYAAVQLAWMYLTPIIYPIDAIPERFRWLIKINPMYYLVELFRDPIYGGKLPGFGMLWPAVASAVVLLVCGWVLFERRADRIAYLV
jgi:ABC-type polysaccharide/polyol phosphate export permease